MSLLEATPTVTTADLKQNPAAVLRKVLENGTHRITAHGKPTGAVIAPEVPKKRVAIPGDELMAAITPIPEEARRSWMADIESVFVDDDYI